MDYSGKARIFLSRHGTEPESVNLSDVTAAFLSEMELGLSGGKSSLKMIPSYLTADGALPLGRPAAVIDAGGTNFRTALVSFTEHGPEVESLSVTAMPGALSPVTWDEFIDFTAARLLPLLDRTDTVGFCFSYPTEETPERDGRIIKLTKQVIIDGFENRLLCADLQARLTALGVGRKNIVLLNDTPAVLLSGVGASREGEFDGLIGLISGTGTNTCCNLPNSAIRKPHGAFSGNMLVNLESGAFSLLPRGDFDALLDAATLDPDTYRHEKMTSGAYVGELCRLALREAAEEGLFSAEGADSALSLSALATPEADALALGGDMSLFADVNDAAFAAELCRAMFERAARCLCANLSAILILTDSGHSAAKPACIRVDGSMFKKSRVFRPELERYMSEFTAARLCRHAVFRTADEATLLGSAAAALLNS
ncbi:MAG: hypothetical protein RR314_07290 [Oscillospiraceae bacterium]